MLYKAYDVNGIKMHEIGRLWEIMNARIRQNDNTVY